METPGTSGGVKKLCVPTKNLQETSDKDENRTVSIMDKDERQLLTIFPEEIWRKILGNVDRSSLESVNNASSFFRRLLYPERQLFLFSSVWKILGVKYEVDSDPVYCDLELKDGDLNDARDDEELEKPTFSVIRKLRLVCREWCLGINKFYEDLYYNYDTEEAVLQPRVQSGLDSAGEVAINRKYRQGQDKMGQWSEFKLTSEEMIQDFMEHFEATHDSQTNPFPFRKVSFHSSTDIMSYMTEALPLVKKYGHHIWFCELYLSGSFTCYLKFQKMLTLMTNLKVLRLMLKPDYCLRKEVLVTHPFPRLENLTFVSFNDTTEFMMENLLQKNPQVTKIEILCLALEAFDFRIVPLPNLTHLSVRFETMIEFEMFENCGKLWQLEILHMMFAINSEPVPFNPHPRIFKCLEQFKDSLTDVVVTFPNVERDEDRAEIVRNFRIRLDLPLVKRLRLTMTDYMSLDFILPMKNTLELLEYSPRWIVQEWYPIPEYLKEKMKREEVIQFHSVQIPSTATFSMYSSNIWKLFPKLGNIYEKNVVEDVDQTFRNGRTFIREKKKK